jgi:hypothetical protein
MEALSAGTRGSIGPKGQRRRMRCAEASGEGAMSLRGAAPRGRPWTPRVRELVHPAVNGCTSCGAGVGCRDRFRDSVMTRMSGSAE